MASRMGFGVGAMLMIVLRSWVCTVVSIAIKGTLCLRRSLVCISGDWEVASEHVL